MKVCASVHLVGGSDLSGPSDCLVYAVDLGDLVLIDCGTGPGYPRIRDNIRDSGLDPFHIHTLLLTHCHVDHIGAVSQVVADVPDVRVLAHALDCEAIESGDPVRTASSWYGTDLPAVRVTRRIEGSEETLSFSGGELQLLHTPGHTPGSIVAVLRVEGQTVLFGQDIHGPFYDEFGSDIAAWRRSMEQLLALQADILCEGHFGVYRGKDRVREFIEGHLEANA